MLGLGQASGLYLLGQPLGPLIRADPLLYGRKEIKEFLMGLTFTTS